MIFTGYGCWVDLWVEVCSGVCQVRFVAHQTPVTKKKKSVFRKVFMMGFEMCYEGRCVLRLTEMNVKWEGIDEVV